MSGSIDKIKKEIDGTTDEEILKYSITQLVNEPCEESIFILKTMSLSNDNVEVRYYAKKALDYLETKTNLEKPFEEFINFDIREIVKKFNSKNSEVRLNAAINALKCDNKEILPFCVEQLKCEDDNYVIATLVKAIGKYGNKKIIEVLEPYLKNTDSRIQANTIEALEMIGDKSVYPLIIPLLQDVDNRVRANAIKALKNCIQVNVVDVLNEMSTSIEIWMRDSAAYALGEINNEDSIDLLKKLLNDKSSNVRNTAYEALVKLSENGSLKAESVLENIEEIEDIIDIYDLLDTLEPL